MSQPATTVTVIVGPEGRLRYISPAVERVLGFPATGLMGAVGLRWVHPDHRTTGGLAR
jgi:hypothetical protein